jgi:hypothetical protein
VAKENVVNNQEQDIADAVESSLGIDESETTSNSTAKVVYRGRCSCMVAEKPAILPDINPATIPCKKHGETLTKSELKKIVIK